MRGTITTRFFFGDGTVELVELTERPARQQSLSWPIETVEDVHVQRRTLWRHSTIIPPGVLGPVEGWEVPQLRGIFSSDEGWRHAVVFVEDGARYRVLTRH